MQIPRENRGSKWSKAVSLRRILVEIARVWVQFERILIESGESGPKRPYPEAMR